MRTTKSLGCAALALGFAVCAQAESGGPGYEETLDYISDKFYECGMTRPEKPIDSDGYSYELSYSRDVVTIVETRHISYSPTNDVVRHTFRPKRIIKVDWVSLGSGYKDYVSAVHLSIRGSGRISIYCFNHINERLSNAFKHLQAISGGGAKEDPFAPESEG